MHQLSLHPDDYSFFKELKVDRFAKFGLDVHACSQWKPKNPATIAQASHLAVSHIFRIPLPFNKHIESAAELVASELSSVFGMVLRDIAVDRVQPVFENHGRPLAVLLRHLKFSHIDWN